MAKDKHGAEITIGSAVTYFGERAEVRQVIFTGRETAKKDDGTVVVIDEGAAHVLIGGATVPEQRVPAAAVEKAV